MAATDLTTQDWTHRLHVLSAWRTYRDEHTAPDPDQGATYRAVLDGCAITVRALCGLLGVGCHFGAFEKIVPQTSDRSKALLACCYEKSRQKVLALGSQEEQRCLLEVLFLGNRAVAHPGDKGLGHEVRQPEMTSAINTVLRWLAEKKGEWPALAAVPEKYFRAVAAPAAASRVAR